MLSGGADSVCLLDVVRALDAEVSALHVNYGLRPAAAGDEDLCRALCEHLEVPLHVERAELPESGNLQASARAVRYAHAERLAAGDYASAHTASDQAETVLYRLTTSPGRRALLGMAPRRGRLVRPLLEVTAEDTRSHCRSRDLEWREDESNSDARYARARLRHEVLPVLREIGPAAERTIVETAGLLRDEAEVLDAAVQEALAALGPAPALADLRERPAGLARLVLRQLAEAAAGRELALSRPDVDAILALGNRGGTQSLDLGGGVRAVAKYGRLRFSSPAPAFTELEPVLLPVPGAVRFGPWEVAARLAGPGERAVGDERLLDAAALGRGVQVRAWRSGDRMRPEGLGGTKSLQDLFTDRKIPRALRRELPVVEAANGDIAWVAGVAVGEGFAAGADGDGAAILAARRTAGA